MSYKPSIPVVASFGANSSVDIEIPFMTSNLEQTNVTSPLDIEMKHSGSVKFLNVYISSNAAGSPSTVTLRKNGVDTSLFVSFPASTTGSFTNNVDEVFFEAGDTLVWYVDKSSQNAISHLSANMFSNGKQVNIIGHGIPVNFNTASVTRFYSLLGSSAASISTAHNDNVQFVMQSPCKAKNMMVRITSNARTGTITYRLVKSPGVNGNSVISIAAGLTGDFWDTTNTDDLVVGDTPVFSITSGSGTQVITRSILKIDLESEPYHYSAFNRDYAVNQSFNTTRYMNLFASPVTSTADAISRFTMRGDGKFKSLRVQNVRTNVKSGATTITLRINGADTAISVSIPAATTGTFTDLTNSVDFRYGDSVNYKIVATSTGGLVTGIITLGVFQNSGKKTRATIVQ